MSTTIPRTGHEPDLLDLLAGEPSDPRRRDRETIEAAVMATAAERRTFSIRHIRPHIGDVQDKMIGATITALVRSGVLVWTGEFDESGNGAQRNAHRPVKVYRLGAAS